MMTNTRIRTIEKMAPRVNERKARELYMEIFGAWPGDSVPEARVKESLVEACRELLYK
jgi:hypothetical protein